MRIGLLVLLFAFTIGPVAADPIPDDIGGRVTARYVAPSLAGFDDAAAEMDRLANALCDRADDEALTAARGGFAVLVRAWARVSLLRFGPLQAENRFERVFFWPDPRGVIVRQVQALLAGGDESGLTPDGLSGKSVALQGLPALEFVLHGSGAEELTGPPGSYRCRYGAAVAANLAGIARELAAEWATGAAFHAAFASPSPSGDVYRSKQEVAGEIVKAAGTGLQFVRNAELLPALGETAQKARGRRAPLWRSDLTFVFAGAQVEGLSALLESTGFDQSEEAAAIADALRFDLGHARDALLAISAPAEDAFADEADRERIRYVTVVLEAANAALGERLSAALGLTMGFNALDGD